ncbi:MAG TPA: histidine kinase [Polyangiaceae bacterium]
MPPRVALWSKIVLAWLFFGLISGTQVWLGMLTHGHSVPRLLGYHVVVWLAWLGPTYVIVVLARRFPVVPPRPLPVLVHVLAATGVFLGHGLLWIGLCLWMRPFDRMNATLESVHPGEFLLGCFPLEWTLYALVLGAAIAVEYYRRTQERAAELAGVRASLADARLHALELQIQPHSLFNTMNAISALIRAGRSEEAVSMVNGMSELLRYALDHAGRTHVALDEELRVLERYLQIQHVRFPDRMSFHIDAPREVRRGAVPALLLQPLAENEVRHGIAKSAAAGVVEVRAFREGDRLHIELFNSGALGATSPAGIGLTNTVERLRHLYGEAGGFDLSASRGGVLARVAIPWTEAT